MTTQTVGELIRRKATNISEIAAKAIARAAESRLPSVTCVWPDSRPIHHGFDFEPFDPIFYREGCRVQPGLAKRRKNGFWGVGTRSAPASILRLFRGQWDKLAILGREADTADEFEPSRWRRSRRRIAFWAFCLAKFGIAPSIFFPVAVSRCMTQSTRSSEIRQLGDIHDPKAFVAAIVGWNTVALDVELAYPDKTIGQLVNLGYEACSGISKPRMGLLNGLRCLWAPSSITLPATLASLWLFDRMLRRPWIWRRSLLTITIWEALVVLVIVGSYETGFPYPH